MNKLKGYQKKYLRGMAHSLKPIVFIGQKGMTDAVNREMNIALDTHELVKLKFLEFKEKKQKIDIINRIEEKTHCRMAGMIGHIAIFYRQHNDPEKRKINLPVRQNEKK